MSALQDGMGLTAGRDVQPAYARVQELLGAERCVILDGGIATELGRRLPDAERGRDEALWGTWGLVHAPDVVRDVHRSYVEQGCDVISTNTWGLTAEMQTQRTGHLVPLHWMDIVRRGVEIGREAIDLYPWVPRDRYDVVVASLYQMPVDPYEQPNSHRPLDFWGRNLLDHLFTLLPKLLADDGVA